MNKMTESVQATCGLPQVATWLLVAAVCLWGGCRPAATSDGHEGHDHAAVNHESHEGCGEGEAGPDGVRQCPEHAVALEDCGICRPLKIPLLTAGQGLLVRLPSTNSAGILGVQTAPAVQGPVEETVDCNADLAFNQNRLAELVSPVGGIIESVEVDLGSRVEERQVVARIWSAAIAEAVAKAVLTHQTMAREQRLRGQQVTAEKDLQEAEASHRAACQQLRTLGFTEAQIDELGARPQESVLLDLPAPFAGEIIERAAVRGALVEAGRPLFKLADRSVMWAMLNLPEEALAKVAVGQRVELSVDSLPGLVVTGKLTWIAAEVDDRSRLARARVEVPNPEGKLRARMFAQARIITRQIGEAVLAPEEAFQVIEGKPFVFVQREPDLFEARVVEKGVRTRQGVEVRVGLKAGEAVVVERGFAVKSALLMSRLGAGCADD